MEPNSKEVLITLADQTKTTGAAYSGDLIETVPADFAAATTALASLTSTGYLGEDGIAVSSSISLSDFREMNRNIVRRGIDSTEATISYTELQLMAEDVLVKKFGEDNVSTVAATAQHGKQTRVKVGSSLPPIGTHAFKLKDGDVRAILWVPRGQVTNGIDVTFASNSIASIPIEISCYDDGTGGLFYIFFDDGTVVTGG